MNVIFGRKFGAGPWGVVPAVLLIVACAMQPVQMKIEGVDPPLAAETILESATGRTITFEQLVDKLAQARVVYVGERHTSPRHHQIQLQVIQALVARLQKVSVGMEMFDHTYQRRLDRWSAGQMQWDHFLQQTHWYANWKFDANLYKDILIYIRDNNLPLVGLNIPFHLPSKIGVGGLESLREAERNYLPRRIDTTHAGHRAYLQKIFKMHKIKGRYEFENFYAAQCAWEEGMAENISQHLRRNIMVVLAGNGHIIRKFGIPQRAHKRTGASYLTLYLATPTMEVARGDGDFIWVAPHTS